MLNIGIDAISFYTSHYYLDLETLAKVRGVELGKFNEGLGQFKMAVPAPDEDIVTLGANAAQSLLEKENITDIDTLFFATESGIDQSKAAGLFVHELLKLPSTCRVLELKQACYSATGAIQIALGMIHQNPKRKILVIAADVARYGLNTTGESSQGCGAVAMLLTSNPRLLTIESGSGIHTESVMDFWRPNYLDEALVEGKYSSKLYMTSLRNAWADYQKNTGRTFEDHDYFCYHAPVPRLVEKAHASLAKLNESTRDEISLQQQIQESLIYGREIGNSYTASLYVGLTSLLDNSAMDLSNKRIGFYSYGSGCVAEFFSGVVNPGYKVQREEHQHLLKNRAELSYADYEKFYLSELPKDGSEHILEKHRTGRFRLWGSKDHKRLYEALESL